MATNWSWANVAHRKSPIIPTTCVVNLEQYSTPVHLPPSSSQYSTFLPLPTGFNNAKLLATLADLLNSTISIVPHADLSLLEVCFVNVEAQQDFLSSLFKSQ